MISFLLLYTTRPAKHAVLFWLLVKSDLFSVRYCTPVHWTRHFIQGTRNTCSFIIGRPVRTGSCIENQTGLIKISSSHRISKKSTGKNQVACRVESPVRTYYIINIFSSSPIRLVS